MPLPPLPEGFQLDQPEQGTPPLPPGFTLDSAPKPEDQNSLKDRLLRPVGLAETAAHVATGAVAGPLAGLAGIATGASNTIMDTFGAKGPKPNPAEVVQSVSSGMTYGPKTAPGQRYTRALEYPFKKLGEGADIAGEKVAEVTGSPAAGAAVNTLIQAAPLIAGRRGVVRAGAEADVRSAGGTIKEGTSDAAAAARAKTYVNQSLGVDWDSIAPAFQKKLTDLAKDATALDRLDPKAVARQARLASLDVPATRGQVTRDLGQLTTEENLSKSDAGKPLRDIMSQQDVKLHESLDTLRKETGAAATTRSGVGSSVQGALRAKLRETKSSANKAYTAANEIGEKELVDRQHLWQLNQFIKQPINKANVGWIADRLEALKDPNGLISLKSLEDVRQELTAAAKNPNKGGHYAGEAAKVIDKIMDESGSDAYKNARSQWKGMKDEFDKQTRVKKLVTEKGFSSERATALEDTLDAVLKSPTEEIGKIKRSLLEAKTSSLRVQGLQAWKDIQGGVIDKLKESAAGRRAVGGENEQLQFSAAFRDVFNELEADGKIDAIFSKEQATKLRLINKVVEDVRTKPAGRISGSDTVPRIINMLDKITKIPIVGDIAAGTVKGAQKLHEMGVEGRRVREAQITPLDEALKQKARTNEGIGAL